MHYLALHNERVLHIAASIAAMPRARVVRREVQHPSFHPAHPMQDHPQRFVAKGQSAAAPDVSLQPHKLPAAELPEGEESGRTP